ncbi:MAG: PAS domain-containing sensor histidine kinase, partial [Candidatus Riflebacteria bacterium]|nr:PAS domain-containing sensor histidine kinase [Candidatus Riflebacteria bacterium]
YLRGLIESSVDGLITVDPEGYITDVNAQMCRMTGHDRQALVGTLFKQYFTDAERADAGVKRTLVEGVVTNYELVLKLRAGRRATVSLNASVFRTSTGRIQGIFASARDISEQAHLQQQLAEQQAYNRSLIEASPDAQFAVAPDGTVTDVNEEATRLTGCSRRHLVNSKFADHFTEPERALACVRQTLAEHRVLGVELVLVTRLGRRVTVSFNAGVFTDAAGAPLGILATARDISSQKQLEHQLRDLQFYTRSLVESNIDALMTTDPLGTITDVNQQMVALTGCPRDELIGTPCKQYFTDSERADDAIRQVLREGRVTNYDLTVRSRSGQETVVSYNATTFDDQTGKLQGVFAAARDITERKRFERALQEKNTELESASRAKDRFLASMSHELRTPLNAIIGYSGTLLMKLPGPLTHDQEKQIRTVQGSGRHLLSLINDLLNLAKIESGKVVLELAPVDCREALEEVMAALRPAAAERGLALLCKSGPEKLALRTDRRSLIQILLNLASNGIKFTEKGNVTIELARRKVDGSSWVDFVVTDTGIGIRPEDQVRLFEAFTQVGRTDRSLQDGSGLGLHLCRKLADLLGGQVTFESQSGTGSRFTLSLPDR